MSQVSLQICKDACKDGIGFEDANVISNIMYEFQTVDKNILFESFFLIESQIFQFNF